MPAVVLVTRASTDTQYYSRLLPYPRILLRRGVVIFKASQLSGLVGFWGHTVALGTPLWGLARAPCVPRFGGLPGHPVLHWCTDTIHQPLLMQSMAHILSREFAAVAFAAVSSWRFTAVRLPAHPAHRTMNAPLSAELIHFTAVRLNTPLVGLCWRSLICSLLSACTSRSQDYERTPVGFGVALFLISRSACQDMLGRFYDAFCEW